MAIKKTAARRAAELIARADAIQVKSAQRRLQRAAKSGVPVKAPEKLSRYGKSLFRKVVEEKRRVYLERSEPVKPERFYEPEPEPIERRSFSYAGTRLMKLKGLVELGSSGSGDLRNRYVNAPVTARQANAILNAEDSREAIDLFAKAAPYLADVREFDHFVFDGEFIDEDFFE